MFTKALWNIQLIDTALIVTYSSPSFCIAIFILTLLNWQVVSRQLFTCRRKPTDWLVPPAFALLFFSWCICNSVGVRPFCSNQQLYSLSIYSILISILFNRNEPPESERRVSKCRPLWMRLPLGRWSSMSSIRCTSCCGALGCKASPPHISFQTFPFSKGHASVIIAYYCILHTIVFDCFWLSLIVFVIFQLKLVMLILRRSR